MGKRLTAILLAVVISVTLCLAANPDIADLVPETDVNGQEKNAASDTPDTQEPVAATEDKTEDTAPDTQEKVPAAVAAPVPALPDAQAEEPAETTEQPEGPIDDGGPIDFTDIDKIVHANNLTIQANQYTYDSIQGVNNNYMMMTLERSRNSIESLTNSLSTAYAMVARVDRTTNNEEVSMLAGAMQENLGATIGLVSSSVGQINSQLASITDNVEDAEDAKKTSEKQFAYVADQLAMGAQTIYISLNALDLQQKDLQRSLNTMDRSLTEMQKRVDLGQVSEIQLLQLKNQRKTLATSIETLKSSVKGLKGDLAVLLGRTYTPDLQLYALPDPTLPERNYEEDLKTALAASYDLYFKQETLDDAADFNDYVGNPRDENYSVRVKEVESLQNTYQAAKLTYEATEIQFSQSFSKLYDSLDEAQRQLELAQETVDLQKRLWDTAALKYERGMISKNALQTAKDDYEAAQSTLKSKKIDLFSAINQYEWAKKGVMGS